MDSITRVSWSLGDMPLSAWRLKRGGILGLVGTVLRDQDAETCMYLIGNRQYNADRSRQKEAARRRKGKGKGGRGSGSTSGAGSGRKWNVSYVDAAWGRGKGRG